MKSPDRAVKAAAVIILGCAMMGCGIFRGEVPTVLNKAVNICLECIGLS